MNIYKNILHLFLLLVTVFLSPGLSAATQASPPPYPEFTANYDIRVNGFQVATTTFSLRYLADHQYLYQQKTRTSGFGNVFSSENGDASSRWRYTDEGIEVLEYSTARKGGDSDDNVHLHFDWKTLKVSNSKKPQWSIAVPKGALDQMVMQLAMLLELRDGAKKFEFDVVRGNASVKRYIFEVVGEPTLELNNKKYKTIELMRTNDSKDLSRIWSAPELNYFPVRFLKEKKRGLSIEMIMRSVQFKDSNS